MPVERIAAAGFPQPVQNQTYRLAPGEAVQLIFDAAAGADLLATTMDGVRLRLAGLGSLAHGLAPGSLLELRVPGATHRLELLMPAAPARSDATAAEATEPADTAAMRVDQAALASSWRAMALDHFGRHAMPSGQGLALRLPSSLLSGGSDAAVGQGMSAARAATGNEQWPFMPLAGGPQRPMLMAFDADEDDDDDDPAARHKPKRRRGVFALLLEFILPGLGRLRVRCSCPCPRSDSCSCP
jgi:hypothetical protein